MAQAVYDTWGQRCTYLYFLSAKSSEENERGMPMLHNPGEESYDQLWGKVKWGFTFAHNHLINHVDWVLKADDDTYVIMENMHNMLAQHSPADPVYFGSFFQTLANPGYMSGGSGYVISRAALERVVPNFNNSEKCRSFDGRGAEDAEMGKCLINSGVKVIKTTSEAEEETFLPLNVVQTMQNDIPWYNHSKPNAKRGFECCSSRPISFHYVGWTNMYEYEYHIYKTSVADLSEIWANYERRINSSVDFSWPVIPPRPEEQPAALKLANRLARLVKRTLW